MATGARQDELLKARRDGVDHDRRQLTIIGKGNKQRVIDLDPFGGYALISVLPAYAGKPLLFWHSDGESYKSFASQFRKDRPADGGMGESKRCRISAVPFPRSPPLACCRNGSRKAARSMICNVGSGTPASRRPKSIANISRPTRNGSPSRQPVQKAVQRTDKQHRNPCSIAITCNVGGLGLGNRCSIRLSYGTNSKSASSGAFAGIKSGLPRCIASAARPKPASCLGTRQTPRAQ